MPFEPKFNNHQQIIFSIHLKVRSLKNGKPRVIFGKPSLLFIDFRENRVYFQFRHLTGMMDIPNGKHTHFLKH